MGESWGQRANDPRHCRHCRTDSHPIAGPCDDGDDDGRRRRLFYVRRRQQVACRGFLGSRGLRTYTYTHTPSHHDPGPGPRAPFQTPLRTLWERKDFSYFSTSTDRRLVSVYFFSQRDVLRFIIYNNVHIITNRITNRTIVSYNV